MKTEYELASALKSLMEDYPLDEISVSLLTKKCGIQRQTFYYHFRDIYDLLTLVILNEKIPGIDDAKDFKHLCSLVFSYYKKNEKFIDATLESSGKELIIQLFYHAFYNLTLRLCFNYEIGKKIDLKKRKSIARFFASSYSQNICYYLTSNKNKTEQGLVNTFDFISDDVFTKMLQNALKGNEIDG